MSFNCVICTERLDKKPASQPATVGVGKDMDIASTPCGHIFHTFCIQKWLTGDFPSSKLCPCCRNVVHKGRTLPLFPNLADPCLDNSFVGGDTDSSCDHSHFHSQISALKDRIEAIQDRKNEMETLLKIESDMSKEYKAKLEVERNRSDSYMMQWKSLESYKSFSEQLQKEKDELLEKLQKYKIIERMVKGVKEDVDFDRNYTPNPESLREIQHVLAAEFKNATKKLNEAQEKQESYRVKIASLTKKLKTVEHEYEELRKAHFEGSSSALTFGTPSPAHALTAKQNIFTKITPSPLTSKKNHLSLRANIGEQIITDSNDPDILLQPFGKQPKRKLIKSSTTTKSTEDNERNYLSQTNIAPDVLNLVHSPPLKSHTKFQFRKKAKIFEYEHDQQNSSKINAATVQPPQKRTEPTRSEVAKVLSTNHPPVDWDMNDEDVMPLRGSIPGMKVHARNNSIPLAKLFRK